DIAQALQRVSDVAPFIPTFQRPEGWAPPSNLPVPVDFVPVDGQLLAIPDDITIPPGTELPADVFEPVSPPQPPAPQPKPDPEVDPYTLTVNQDTLQGTGADEIFRGILDPTTGSADSTLTTGDQIFGGGGND